MTFLNKCCFIFLCGIISTTFPLGAMQEPSVVFVTRPYVDYTAQADNLDSRIKMLTQDYELSRDDLKEALIAVHRETSDSLCDCLDHFDPKNALAFLNIKHKLEKDYPEFLENYTFIPLLTEHAKISDFLLRLQKKKDQAIVVYKLLDLKHLLIIYSATLKKRHDENVDLFLDFQKEVDALIEKKIKELPDQENFLEDVD